MAIPRLQDKQHEYYHGTDNVENVKQILKDGFLKGPEIQEKSKFAPRKENVYFGRVPADALSYSLGFLFDKNGFESTVEYEEEKGRSIGFMFVISGEDLVDIEPDEDSIGSILNQILNNKNPLNFSSNEIEQLKNLCKWKLTPKQFLKLKNYNDFADLAQIGKKLTSFIPDYLKYKMIDNGTISNKGKIKFKEVWKFNKRDASPSIIGEDGKDFRKIAERIY